jgi:hypothetical protein
MIKNENEKKSELCYSIVTFSDSNSGGEKVINFLSGRNFMDYKIKLTNYDLTNVNNNNSQNLQNNLLDFYRTITDGINLILFFLPVVSLRPTFSHLEQAIRLLGRDCTSNILIILTCGEFLIESDRKTKYKQYIEELPRLFIKNMIDIKRDNVCIWDDGVKESEDFRRNIIRLLRDNVKYYCKTCDKLLKFECKNENVSLLLRNICQDNSDLIEFFKNEPKFNISFRDDFNNDKIAHINTTKEPSILNKRFILLNIPKLIIISLLYKNYYDNFSTYGGILANFGVGIFRFCKKRQFLRGILEVISGACLLNTKYGGICYIIGAFINIGLDIIYGYKNKSKLN